MSGDVSVCFKDGLNVIEMIVNSSDCKVLLSTGLRYTGRLCS